MKVQRNIDIYLLKNRMSRPIELVQYDTGVQLVLNVKVYAIPTGTTATMYIQKPSGKFVYQESGIVVATNSITIDLENQAVTEHGKVSYQVTLKNGTDEITTFTGLLDVQKSLKDFGATESKTVIRAFDEAITERIAKFQTEAEKIAQAVIATIPDDYTTLTTKVNELANAIKGKKSGYIVAMDDVSPVEHNLKMYVHGKNLAKSFLNESSGTDYANCLYVDANLKPNTTYTISFVGAENHAIYFNENITTVYTWTKCTGERQAITFTTKRDITSQYYDGKGYAIAKNNPNNTIVPNFTEVQIEESSIETEYENYIEPTTVKVKKTGKNLIPYPYYQSNSEINGCKFVANSDGSISGSGTATGVSYLTIYGGNPIVKQGKFTISLSGNYQNIIYHLILLDSDENELLVIQDSQTYTINTDDYPTATKWLLNIKRHQNSAISGRVYPQIEIGENATGYEEYKEAIEYIPSSDGTVVGITSLSPNMTLFTDNENVIVECEYNKDTNKVIEKLVNAIVALGGNVTI